MDSKFAKRAKEIVSRNGANKQAAMAELDALRREQLGYEKSITTNREIDNGVAVEKEHKPTLDFIKKYHKENGKFPTLNKVAKSIAVDHITDMKKNPNNPGYETYYEGLIGNGLSDEVAKYMANGGFIHPMNIPDSELENIRAMALGGPIKVQPDSIKTNNIKTVDVAVKGPTVNELRDKFGDFGTPAQRIAIRDAIKRLNAKSDTIVTPHAGRKQMPVAEFSIGGPLTPKLPYNPGMPNLYDKGGDKRYPELTTPMFTTPMKSSFDRAVAPAGMNDLKSSNINDRIAALKSDINGSNSGSIDTNSLMRLSPVLFNAMSGIGLRRSKPMDTSISTRTISPTIISPEQISTSPIEDMSAVGYRGATGSASGAASGSSAALRSALSGINRSISRSTGEAMSGIYDKNAMLRGDATARNAESTDAANMINLDQANRADQIARGNLIANAQDEAAYSQAKMGNLSGAFSDIGAIGKENQFMEVLKLVYGIDPSTGKKIPYRRGGKMKRC